MSKRLNEMKKRPREKQVRFLTTFWDAIMLIELKGSIILLNDINNIVKSYFYETSLHINLNKVG